MQKNDLPFFIFQVLGGNLSHRRADESILRLFSCDLSAFIIFDDKILIAKKEGDLKRRYIMTLKTIKKIGGL